MGERTVSQRVLYRDDTDSEVGAYMSRPMGSGTWPGVVTVHEWWGLDGHFRELSRRLAREGFVVLVPDLYEGEITDDWNEAARLKANLNVESATEKVTAGPNFLRSLPYVTEACGVLGFCMGGGIALLALAGTDDFDVGVVYYPSIYPEAADLEAIRCPLQLHYGLEDVATPKLEIDRIERALKQQSVSVERRQYEDAEHAFTNDEYGELYDEEAAEKAWSHTVEFLQEHLND